MTSLNYGQMSPTSLSPTCTFLFPDVAGSLSLQNKVISYPLNPAISTAKIANYKISTVPFHK